MQSKPLCDRCGEKPATRWLGGASYDKTGEHVCNACALRQGRRDAGIEPRVVLTDEQRRTYAASLAMKYHRQRKARVFAHYGGRCVCCGETHEAFLAIDHIDGGGNVHRRSMTANGTMAGSSNFYRWIISNGFPADLQVLCHNCNFAKSHYPGGCPHQTGVTL